jgi:hypothetical protein
MVVAFGSIAGCPKSSTKKPTGAGSESAAGAGTATGGAVVVTGKTGATGVDVPSKDTLTVTAITTDPVEAGKPVKVKFEVMRGEGVKDKDVILTFSTDKGVKDLDKVTIVAGKKHSDEVTITTTDMFKADVVLDITAKAGDVTGTGKLTVKKK